MRLILSMLKIVFLLIIGIFFGVILFAIPATLSLPRGFRTGVTRMSISQASKQLQQTGKLGWQLVEAARALVAERIHYCRRNSFDAAPIAFERGYGYCQQQAFALVDILTDLGFQAKVVGAFRNRLPTGNIAGHAWVRVTVEGETHDIDTMHYNKKSAKLTFTPLTQVFEYTPLKRVFFGWGSAAVNAYRYYASGVDY